MKEDNPPKELCPMCGNEMEYLDTEKFGRAYWCNDKMCINDGMEVIMYIASIDPHERAR